jgi:alpha-L-fucosidase 2
VKLRFVAGKGEKAVTLKVWVDANNPVIHLEADSQSAFDMQAKLEVWRTEKRELLEKEASSAYGAHGGPNPIYVYPDTIVNDRENQIVWYHRNESSIWEDNLRHQGMADLIPRMNDPLLHRTFGGCIIGTGLVSGDATTLKSQAPQNRFVLSIHPLCAQTETAEAWLEKLEQSVSTNNLDELDADRTQHREWWNNFWNRSWIRVTGNPYLETLTQAYTLQRWVSACAGRGAHPIKFNGTIFTVDGAGFDADYRAWGGPYWWQNTRLPYWPMLACGDYDMMQPLFSMYQEMLPFKSSAHKPGSDMAAVSLAKPCTSGACTTTRTTAGCGTRTCPSAN